MRISSLALAVVASALMLAGCNISQTDSSSADTPTPKVDADPVVAAAAAGTTESTSSSSTPTAASQPSEEKPAEENKTASSNQTNTKAESEPPHELIAGITNPGLVRQFELTFKVASENLTDLQAQLQYINVLQAVGMERVKRKEMDKGYATFTVAGDVARRLLEAKIEFKVGAGSGALQRRLLSESSRRC
jgi:hypothetical protein